MLKETQAFHALPAEQGSTALWLETECPLAWGLEQAAGGEATAGGEGAEPPWLVLESKVTMHKA